MTKIEMIDPESVTGRTKLLFDGLFKKRGRITNMVRVLANSPAAVNAYFSFNSAMAGGELPVAIRERIAIAVAQANGCTTCLAVHTQFGRNEGVSDAELYAARSEESEDPQIATALRFALSVMRGVGNVRDAELTEIRESGYSEAAIMEIIATVFINVFTNAINHIGKTISDYPEVPCAR
jgi:uncharacterized peroxidase-related enzyme